MKTLLLSLSILFLGLVLVAFRETQAPATRAEAAWTSAPASGFADEAPALASPTRVAPAGQGQGERLPWLGMLGAWIGVNLLVLVGLWTAWRFYGRGGESGSALSLA